MGTRIFNKVKAFAIRFWPELTFGGVAILILWRLLLPGLVFAIDMVWPVRWIVLPDYGVYIYSYPLQYLIVLAQHIVPLWLVQKILLVAVLWAAGWLGYRFLPVGGGRLPRVVAAFIYVCNPFVYARLLAGHWMLLAGYALLPLVADRSIRLARDPSRRTALHAGLALAAVGMWSVHMLVLACMVVAAFWLSEARRPRSLLFAAGAVGILLAVSAYWLVPLTWSGGASGWSWAEWKAFAPTAVGGVPVFVRLLTLNGYWGEGMPWGMRFAWPQQFASFWVASLFIGSVAAAGAWYGWRSDRRRFAAVIGLLAGGVVCAAGAAPTLLAPFNETLVRWVPLWGGFRESHKFIALAALAWACLAGWGIRWTSERLAGSRALRAVLAGAVFLLAAAWVPPLWFGLHGQLAVATYPESWERLSAWHYDNPGQFLVLPWHRYYMVRFTGKLMDSPAYFTFWPDAVVSRNIELPGVRHTEEDGWYRALDDAIRMDASAASVSALLIERHITAIVSFPDVRATDPYAYLFLEDRRHFALVVSEQDFTVYAVHE